MSVFLLVFIILSFKGLCLDAFPERLKKCCIFCKEYTYSNSLREKVVTVILACSLSVQVIKLL